MKQILLSVGFLSFLLSPPMLLGCSPVVAVIFLTASAVSWKTSVVEPEP
jgi:hypothetical protein